MQVIVLTELFEPEPGMRGLPLVRALLAEGFQVRVLTGFPNYPGGKIYPGYKTRIWQREEMGGAPVLRVPIYPSHDRSALRRVASYASLALSATAIGLPLIGSGDVVYLAHSPATLGLPALVLRLLRGTPFIYDIGDVWPDAMTDSGMLTDSWVGKLLNSTVRAWCNLLYRRAAAIFVLSNGIKDLLIKRGVSAGKIHVFYSWVDDQVIRPVPSDEAMAARLGLRDGFNIMYAGSMGTVQGLETVIDAAAMVQDLTDLRVVLMGTGPCETALKEYSESIGAANVQFLPACSYREVPAAISLAHVMLVHLKDSFGNTAIPSKIQTALACAKPVLIAVRGSATQLVQEARAGLACEPENPSDMARAFRTLYQMERERLIEMGRNGRNFYLQQMSLDTAGKRVSKILRQIRNGYGVYCGG